MRADWFSSRRPRVKSDPSLQMNPNTLGGDETALGQRHGETQQGESASAKPPMQHSAPHREQKETLV